MPLLLTKTLAATGIIEGLLSSESDTVPAAVNRAKSYFLANALCGNILTFVIGPKILQSHKHRHESENEEFSEVDMETQEGGQEEILSPTNEGISLLHGPIMVQSTSTRQNIRAIGRHAFRQLPTPLRATCTFMYSLWNPVLTGGVIAATLGLIPFLHRAFFNSSREGGIFNAWFITSVDTVGELFVGLQILIVGERVSKSLKHMARGESSGRIPWAGAIPTLLIRYIIWPLYGSPLNPWQG